MLRIALTGNIASGKSEVLNFFSGRGIATVDADAIVKELYRRAAVRKKVFALFRTLDRGEIAKGIFSDAGKRRKLEAILHPLVLREIRHKSGELEAKGKKLVIVEVPLLFEAKMQHMFDKVIVVFCPQKQQIARLRKQGCGRAEALQRIRSQIPMREKVKKADFAIDNSKGLPIALKQAEKIMGELNG